MEIANESNSPLTNQEPEQEKKNSTNESNEESPKSEPNLNGSIPQETPADILRKKAAEAEQRKNERSESEQLSSRSAASNVRNKKKDGTQKGKPGPKPKQTPAPIKEDDQQNDEPFQVTEEDIEDVLDITDGILEAFNIEKLTARNRKTIRKPLMRLGNKYLPKTVSKFSDETKLGLGIATIVIERISFGKQDHGRVRNERDGENDIPEGGRPALKEVVSR